MTLVIVRKTDLWTEIWADRRLTYSGGLISDDCNKITDLWKFYVTWAWDYATDFVMQKYPPKKSFNILNDVDVFEWLCKVVEEQKKVAESVTFICVLVEKETWEFVKINDCGEVHRWNVHVAWAWALQSMFMANNWYSLPSIFEYVNSVNSTVSSTFDYVFIKRWSGEKAKKEKKSIEAKEIIW